MIEPSAEPVPRRDGRAAGAHAAAGADDVDGDEVEGGKVDGGETSSEFNLVGSLAVAVLVGAGLAIAAHGSALALLIVVAAVQALLAVGWIFGTGMPGHRGGLMIAAAAAGGADVAVSVWPHGRLGTLLIVFALALPVMFIHQLMRGAARVRVVQSLSGLATLVAAEAALPAYLQLRHEFAPSSVGAHITAGVLEAAAGALVVGFLVDMLMPAPHFDARAPRGLLAVVASAGLGGSIGHLSIADATQFPGSRGAFVGAAIGVLVALFAVGVAFVEVSSPTPDGAVARRLRVTLSALLPISLIAPVAFLLCLAIRA